MAKFSKLQWALASNITRRAREAVREAKRLQSQFGIVYNIPKIPNRELLRKMNTEEARIILDDLSNIKSEQDLRVRNRGGGNFLSNYDVDKFKSAFTRNEERKSRQREKLNISTTTGTMGSEQDVLTRPARLPNFSDLPEDFEKINSRVQRQAAYNYESEMNALWRNNYLKSIQNGLGPEALDTIIEITSFLNDEDFYIISASNPELEINFNYPTSGEDTYAYIDRIIEAWESAIESKRKYDTGDGDA